MANLSMLLNNFRQFLGRWFPRSEQDPELLRDSFKKHYKTFRSLLTANNNALELMVEMELALKSGRPFGMTFIRSHCTALGFQVSKMIQRLQKLSDGKYSNLDHPLETISERIEAILTRQPHVPEGPCVIEMHEVDKHEADLVGEKMANLGEIANRVGLLVPDGFVITAAAAHRFLSANNLRDEINRRLTICDTDNLEELYTTSAAIHQLVTKAPLPQDIEQEINAAYERLAARTGQENLLMAIRSSALGEDGSTASFAGQYRTHLNVSADLLVQNYKEIVAGKYKSQAIIYRLQKGFRHQDVMMCVGCLAMVDAKFGGVIYTRSPTNLRSSYIIINAAPGLAGQVVDGSVDVDMYYVARDEPYEIILRKRGLVNSVAMLSDSQLMELTRTALLLEKHFGTSLDIEWSIDQDDRIVLLQSRPLGLVSVVIPPSQEVDQGEPDALFAGGSTANPGVGCGPVCIVRSNVDLLRFPKGSVLVVEHALPDWATLLPRASAVISETGQIAAHLATVAREFGIPTLFGIEQALKKLSDGEIVTVDATNRVVFAGRQDNLLSQSATLPNLMEGSPVYKVLEETLSFVTPLNLTDPASPFFRPSSCTTLHDLTRFCHEKAVAEMFSFGSKYRFNEKAAKQLVGETPFHWWVIDLDDGFSEGYDRHDKYVHIGLIVSEPMLAIWQGMTAVPWQGPPPVNLKGFGSVLFQSTMNRELDPAVRSGLSKKNYFMVSRNFCNLSVRLGYHFSLVEAHVSDFITENYVSFQFKGGAANEGRRFARVQLLKDILERFDFRVVQKSDALTARIEKKPAPYILSRLKVLGYLLIHTRQIDMVMDDQAMVEQYRRKILADINELLIPDENSVMDNGHGNNA